MASGCYFAGSGSDYEATLAVWATAVRRPGVPTAANTPASCPPDPAWGPPTSAVYPATGRRRIGIQRIRYRACGVTDALLPRFLPWCRRYLLALIQPAMPQALDRGRGEGPGPDRRGRAVRPRAQWSGATRELGARAQPD
ncbi:MAG: hypothetical protein KKB13_18430 [Chloroflexi bacterium]|nr:hypothetical protein [Chloroflexota bacterium]